MKYLFIDTNNYVACALLTKPKHNIETVDNLINLLNKNKVKLILPEIVKIEFYKKAEETLLEIRRIIIKVINDKLEDIYKNYSFLKEDKRELKRYLKRLLTKREENYKDVRQKIEEIFNNKNVINVPFDNNVLLKAIIRALRGKKPFKKKENNYKEIINQDCLIFESIVSILPKLKRDKKNKLIICSDNYKDFAERDKETKEYLLHHEIMEDLIQNTVYYRNLPEALSKEFEKKIKDSERTQLNESLEFLSKGISPSITSLSEKIRSLKESFESPLQTTAKELSISNSTIEAMTDSLSNSQINDALINLQKSIALSQYQSLLDSANRFQSLFDNYGMHNSIKSIIDKIPVSSIMKEPKMIYNLEKSNKKKMLSEEDLDKENKNKKRNK